MLTLTNLKSAAGARKRTRRRGRGDASGRGSYSGRGQKGQRARSGGRRGLKMLGLKQILRRLPKQRGFKSLSAKPVVINLDDLERNFAAAQLVTPKRLQQLGLIKDWRFGVKLLGSGQLTKPLKVQLTAFSKTAQEAIIKAGGSVEIIKKRLSN